MTGGTVVQVVRQCLPCARTKAGFRQEGKELQPLPIQGIMFRWGIDFAGPMPESKRGNKYILVCIEHSTKWIELIHLNIEHLLRIFWHDLVPQLKC